MTTTAQAFSRPIPFDRGQAQAGDRINMGKRDEPYWQTLISVGDCEHDVEDHGECDGDCAFVLHVGPGDKNEGWDVTWWHVSWAEFDQIDTSLPAVAR